MLLGWWFGAGTREAMSDRAMAASVERIQWKFAKIGINVSEAVADLSFTSDGLMQAVQLSEYDLQILQVYITAIRGECCVLSVMNNVRLSVRPFTVGNPTISTAEQVMTQTSRQNKPHCAVVNNFRRIGWLHLLDVGCDTGVK
jgi:hypothetical protein